MSVKFIDNSDEVLEALEKSTLRGLSKCGLKAHGYATKLVPVDTGNLRNSIAFRVDSGEPAAYIGSNSEYSPYVEFGTGAANVAGGRPGWWVYVPGGSGTGSSKGKVYTKAEAVGIMMALRKRGIDAHVTNGRKPLPFIKPAVADHEKTYVRIIKQEMQNG